MNLLTPISIVAKGLILAGVTWQVGYGLWKVLNTPEASFRHILIVAISIGLPLMVTGFVLLAIDARQRPV